MLDRSVNYLMSGDAHAAYLVVSLRSLRRHYTGKVTVWAYPESIDTVRLIAGDFSLDIRARQWDPIYRGKNGQFFNKLSLLEILPDGANLYLDADTMINASVDSLFKSIEQYGFVATQFGTWVSTGRTIAKRVSRLTGRYPIDQEALKRVLETAYPSVNGGVVGCRPQSSALQIWKAWTEQLLDIFIADETVLHAVMGKFNGPDEALWEHFLVLLGGRFNCSPKYQPAGLPDSEVAIWHFHGDSNTRPDKSKKGFDLWYPEYRDCVEKNVGFINTWLAAARDQNRFLKALDHANSHS